jgi:hypothetical protein
VRVLAAACVLLLAAALVLDPSVHRADGIAIAPSFALVGALIAARRPQTPIGWLFLAFGLVELVEYVADAYAYRALVTHPGSLPGADVAASLAYHLWHVGFGLLVLSLLLFPNGRLLSPRWRWAVAATVVVYGGLAVSGIFEAGALARYSDFPVRPLFAGPVEEVASNVFDVLLGVNLAMVALGGGALILRLRRARGEERQQVKWFVWGVASVTFAFALSGFAFDRAAGVYLFPLIPASAAVAILKHRLFDIDVVVKRTLVYTALTGTLAAAYGVSVLVLQFLLSPSSDLAVAGSTLAAAAVFRPARTRIQALVDRRFSRRRYDAQRVLDAFSARLRDEVALDTIGAALRSAVAETVQPAHVSLTLIDRRPL